MFYGPEQAAIHDARFGGLARDAARLVVDELAAAHITTGTVVDLGCGSGIFAGALDAAGFAVLGVDLAPAMLELARGKAPNAGFTLGSLHDVELPHTVAIVALGEALNYANDPHAGFSALTALATRAFSTLAPGGLLVFDVATPGHAGPTGTIERFHVDETWALGMHAHEHDGRLERVITIFVRDNPEGSWPEGSWPEDGWRRVDEHHVLHLYDPDAVRDALTEIGFVVDVRPGYADPATFPGWRVFVAQRPS